MKITNHRITLGMGTGNWTFIPGLNKTHEKELNAIGYSGNLYGRKMNFQQYLDENFPHEIRFKIEHLSSDAGAFIDTYMITKVEL